MHWWKKIRQSFGRQAEPQEIQEIDFSMESWREEEPSGGMRNWRGPHGSVVSLAELDSNHWSNLAREELYDGARDLAEKAGGGLIQAETLSCGNTSAVRLIYKRLQLPAYVFTGMFFAPLQNWNLVWTMVAGECGTTGVREAVVTTEMYKKGDLKSIEDYERLWAQDPYDPDYHGVDRSVLRFLSDDERYDEQFPDHPLSRVRAFQRKLCNWIGTQQRAKGQSA